MALDVWLNAIGDLPYLDRSHTMERVASLEWGDPDYTFLQPYFASVAVDCGLIDPWEFTSVSGSALAPLLRCFEQARADLLSRPQHWSVEYRSTVPQSAASFVRHFDRAELLRLVGSLIEATQRAQAQGKQVLFFGD